ncbi:MAG: prolipoprotein diacylglyceryl transferase [Planctomycetes bacterium]|nr:prolipoprotein diacylglyceryl transferase [Planctomycetota bacterium]
MHPVLVDLSRFEPFGLSPTSTAVRVAVFVIVAVGAHLLTGGLIRRSAARPRWWTDPASWAMVAGLAAMVAALVWVVSRVHSYGLMLALGFLTAMALTRRRLGRFGEDPDWVNPLAVVALAAGVIGARLAFVIQFHEHFGPVGFDGLPRSMGQRLIEMARLTSGGLVFDGGLILAIAAVLIFLRLRKLPLRRFLDVLAVSAMVGLAFGRMGCLLNGCCYGGVVDPGHPLAVRFPYASVPLVYPHGDDNPFPREAKISPAYITQYEQGDLPAPPALTAGGRLRLPGELDTPDQWQAAREARSLPVHPAQVYGIVNALLLAGLLAAISRLRTREGQVFAWLLILYPITRFMLEMIRDDTPKGFMNLTVAQVKCIGLVAAGVVLLAALRRLPAQCAPLGRQRAAAEAAPAPAPRRHGRRRRT